MGAMAKVMRTNQRLSETLRRLLDARSASDRRRLTQLIAEIRNLAAAMCENPPHGVVGNVAVSRIGLRAIGGFAIGIRILKRRSRFGGSGNAGAERDREAIIQNRIGGTFGGHIVWEWLRYYLGRR